MLDDRRRQRLELGVTVAEVLLIVIRPLLRDASAFRTFAVVHQIRPLAGPPAGRAFDAVMDPCGQFIERHIQRDHRIQCEIVIPEPILEEQCLGQAARESIQDPSAALAIQPIGQDRIHQIIWQVSAPIQNRSGLLAQRGAIFHCFAQQGTGAEVAEAERFREPPSLGSLAGSRWSKECDAERSRRRRGQWARL